MNGNIYIPQSQTCLSEAAYQVLDYGIVDEVIKSQPIWILEFKLIVVCEQAKQVEGWKHFGAVCAVLDVLGAMSIVAAMERLQRTFISEGKRSRWVK